MAPRVLAPMMPSGVPAAWPRPASRRCSLEPLVAAERPFLARPAALDAGQARDPVAQVSDRQSIAAGIVVAQDRTEVVQHQESRPAIAGGQQDRRVGLIGQRPCADGLDGRPDGATPPPACARSARPVRSRTRRAGRLPSPRVPRPPADVAQITGGRGEDVGQAGPQVAPAVAVAVHRMPGEGGRHELRLAHGAGPGPDQAVGAPRRPGR